MRYKVGDKVKVKSLEWYNNHRCSILKSLVYIKPYFKKEMEAFCGLEAVVTKEIEGYEMYRISFNGADSGHYWADYMLEDLIDEPCEYCRDESRRALLSDEKYNESFVEVIGGELVMVTDDTYSTKINNCPMCGRKLQ